MEYFKGSIVAISLIQVEGYDFNKTITPVSRYISLMLAIALAGSNSWHPQYIDVQLLF